MHSSLTGWRSSCRTTPRTRIKAAAPALSAATFRRRGKRSLIAYRLRPIQHQVRTFWPAEAVIDGTYKFPPEESAGIWGEGPLTEVR